MLTSKIAIFVTLLLYNSDVTINLRKSHQPYKTISKAKAIKDVVLLKLLDKDQIQILVFTLELIKDKLKKGKGDIIDKLVY